MVKVLTVLVVLIFGLSLYVDYHATDLVYERAGRTTEQAIDAGIIKSEGELNDSWGSVRIDEDVLKKTIRDEFIKSMKLDDNLENRIMKNTTLKVIYKLDADGVAWVNVKFSTHVSLMLKEISHPVDINRSIAFEPTYN